MNRNRELRHSMWSWVEGWCYARSRQLLISDGCRQDAWPLHWIEAAIKKFNQLYGCDYPIQIEAERFQADAIADGMPR